MEEKRDIEFKIRITKSEKEVLESKAQGKPLAVYVRENALGGYVSESDATEGKNERDGSLNMLIGKFESEEALWEKLVEYHGTISPTKIADILKGGEAEVPLNPLAGYYVLGLNIGEVRGTHLAHKKKGEMHLSENLNEQYLWLIYDTEGDWKPRYKVGDVIPNVLPVKETVC